MKKIWKVLGLATLAAAVPVRFKKDEATGKQTYQSLLLSVDVGPGKDDVHTDIGINIGDGVLTNAISGLVSAKKETELFADDDPEAAVVEAIAEKAEAVAEEVEAKVEELEENIEEFEAKAEEAVDAAVEEVIAEAETVEGDFDPEA